MTESSFDAARAVRQFVTGERGPWGAPVWESLSRAELLEVHREVSAARRRVDAMLAAASAEVARRSEGVAGLARREGFPTPERLVADSTGGTTGEAGRLIAVGEAALAPTRARADVEADGRAGGNPSPAPRFSHLSRAVNAGLVGVGSASAISAMLRRVAGRVAADALEEAERRLVERAQRLPVGKLAVVIKQWEARLDAEAHLRKERAQHEARYLNVFEDRSGMVIIDGRLDPVTAAPLRTAIDALVADGFRRRRDATDQSPGHGLQGPVVSDTRTAPQMRADALADLARHSLGCETDSLPAVKTTVVVRIGLEELRSGVGVGEIDGTHQPVSAGELRRMAADAEVIPAVLGGESEVLDWGRKRRLFTRAQRLALVERDGGCAWCHAPPSYTEAHHIKWWDRDQGPTDLDNGVLLCTSCHHRIHRDHWDIHVRAGTVWFTPPKSIDPRRQPLPGGRARFEYRPPPTRRQKQGQKGQEHARHQHELVTNTA